jgi:hypothetical protein
LSYSKRVTDVTDVTGTFALAFLHLILLLVERECRMALPVQAGHFGVICFSKAKG